MENQRNFLIIALLIITAFIYFKWLEFSQPVEPQVAATQVSQDSSVPNLPTVAVDSNSSLPTVAADQSSIPSLGAPVVAPNRNLISVETDLVVAKINPVGGVIERLELKNEPVSLELPDQGFPLLKNEADEVFVAEDGLIAGQQAAPNHLTQYQTVQNNYVLGAANEVVIPLSWIAPNGVQFTKNIRFSRDSYVVDIDYQVNNRSAEPIAAHIYAQFKRTEPASQGGSFAQLPSFTGGAVYEKEKKYKKIDFDEMGDDNEKVGIKKTDNGWVAMMQHYFVGIWLPGQGERTYFTTAGKQANPQYRIGYKSNIPVVIPAGDVGLVSTQAYLGSKEQKRLNAVEETSGVDGLHLTVDYGWLTVISEPLFWLLSVVFNLVGNWGWSIIIVTFLIKLAFYPLSAKSYKSMAAMKKLQPRMQTLKERYKDDRQKFQMEMMAMYKKEKVNPAGGCLPILIQIPVFLAFYWALLESVEIRQAPFALWLQDLSAPDPFYVLPVLMGVTQFLMTKLNPTPMDDIQKKVMMIMPLVLIVIFVNFPQGLVLYWVVNNILTMAQQWHINRKYA